MISKYEPLARYLINTKENRIRLTFDQVEEIVGELLPPSARLHQAWWSNNDVHTCARNGWLAAGWKTSKVNMAKQELIFIRSLDSSRPYSQQPQFRRQARIFPEFSRHANDQLIQIIQAVGGIDNMSEIVEAVDKYINGTIVETELGRRLRHLWPRR